uniref:Uncharacterized protein n=1 Tax=Chromera velia CCMP2878 TaxID=1169474 RepID=A0A0G4HEP3_9ALVE|eukprot:Cvel_26797.t1-p1 / transcript=Cvel_26797.t1 / gene=Cvel_26797 / organism=Chromera_velia_CCMP2878 / gene_product=hypothetical protein / transcript_product=hypothetical protein / location=Cvel_scaffold3244:13199-14917(-) / protein_length=573 / sequence_SO=supercontig / SO=protein_coding / is_pseudo=false
MTRLHVYAGARGPPRGVLLGPVENFWKQTSRPVGPREQRHTGSGPAKPQQPALPPARVQNKQEQRNVGGATAATSQRAPPKPVPRPPPPPPAPIPLTWMTVANNAIARGGQTSAEQAKATSPSQPITKRKGMQADASGSSPPNQSQASRPQSVFAQMARSTSLRGWGPSASETASRRSTSRHGKPYPATKTADQMPFAHPSTAPFLPALIHIHRETRQLAAHRPPPSASAATHALFARALQIDRKALAPSTRKSYEDALRAVRALSPQNPDEFLPMTEVWQAAAVFSALDGRPASVKRTWKSAIQWKHKRQGLPPPPFEHPALTHYWHGLEKQLRHHVQGKRPLTCQEFEQDFLEGSTRNSSNCALLKARRDAALASLLFFGCRRFGDVQHLIRSHVMRCYKTTESGAFLLDNQGNKIPDGFALFIVRQKNDPYGRGQWLPLSEFTSRVHVGAVWDRFLAVAPAEGPIFRATRGARWAESFDYAKAAGDVRTPTLQRSTWHQSVREAFAARLTQVQAKDIAVHSFHKGGYSRLLRLGFPEDVQIDLIGHRGKSVGAAYGFRPLQELREFQAKM